MPGNLSNFVLKRERERQRKERDCTSKKCKVNKWFQVMIKYEKIQSTPLIFAISILMKFPCKWIQVPKYFVSYKKLIILLRVMDIQKMSVGNVLVVNGQKKCRTKMRKSFDCDEKKKNPK